MPRFVSIASSVGSNAQILPRTTSTNKIKDVDILNIGFEYSSDKTLLPIAKLSPVISLRDFGSITKVSIIDGGKGYITDPRIVVVDSSTREVNDTGFLHAGESLGISAITILGPTSRETGAGVFSDRSYVIENKDLWCRPCSQNGSLPCYRKEQYCMTQIPPELIMNKISKVVT